MKKIIIFSLAAALCLVSCSNDDKQLDTSRPFVENAVELCRNYIGMTPKDAAAKMQQDWNYTAEYDENDAYCYPPMEIIQAYGDEDGQIYKVRYWRDLNNHDGEQASKIIQRVSEDVGNFYEEECPQRFYLGGFTTSDGNDIVTCSDHDEFLDKAKTYGVKSLLAEEKWKDSFLSSWLLSQKKWYVVTDSENKTVIVEFTLDTKD